MVGKIILVVVLVTISSSVLFLARIGLETLIVSYKRKKKIEIEPYSEERFGKKFNQEDAQEIIKEHWRGEEAYWEQN